ncbi:MAG: adenine deaminase [Planctomycetota bacterium]|nr:MAG: adenine deaminase [Planctomycetota bacterium]
MTTHRISGHLVDLHQQRIVDGTLVVEDGRIAAIEEHPVEDGPYVLPGFVDAHIHIESSMMPPTSFAQLAVRFGTVATVSDPHEIANVLGAPGVEYMLDSARQVPLKFHFGCPSCVPATGFETAGAVLDAAEVEKLLARDEIGYLSELMNYPGVLFGDEEVLRKIAAAKALGKPVDGHAPGLRGDDAKRYIEAGITTDHECFTLPEAQDKLRYGMKIIIREGSAARNYEALKSLLETDPERCMLCSDDKHPDDLLEGHINALVRRAVSDGFPLFNVLRAACVHPVEHYGLPVGLLRVGDSADFVLVDNLQDFNCRQTWIDGVCVYDAPEVNFAWTPPETPNHFDCQTKGPEAFAMRDEPRYREVIVAVDRQIVTQREHCELTAVDGLLHADPAADLLKLAVVNRYQNAEPGLALIKNFGLKRGAIASTVAHDSHNIIAVGTSDAMVAKAVNAMASARGGVCYVDDATEAVLPLPIAGLMSDLRPEEIAEGYARIDRLAKEAGSALAAPFMTLSFMALLVIPTLKLSDKGLFDGEKFAFVE